MMVTNQQTNAQISRLKVINVINARKMVEMRSAIMSSSSLLQNTYFAFVATHLPKGSCIAEDLVLCCLNPIKATHLLGMPISTSGQTPPNGTSPGEVILALLYAPNTVAAKRELLINLKKGTEYYH